MQDVSRFLWALILALVLLTMMFGVAAIVFSEFRDSSATAALVGVILAPLTTALSVLGGLTLSRGVKEAVKEESRHNNDPQVSNARGNNGDI